jgi:hypothetical protein
MAPASQWGLATNVGQRPHDNDDRGATEVWLQRQEKATGMKASQSLALSSDSETAKIIETDSQWRCTRFTSRQWYMRSDTSFCTRNHCVLNDSIFELPELCIQSTDLIALLTAFPTDDQKPSRGLAVILPCVILVPLRANLVEIYIDHFCA